MLLFGKKSTQRKAVVRVVKKLFNGGLQGLSLALYMYVDNNLRRWT